MVYLEHRNREKKKKRVRSITANVLFLCAVAAFFSDPFAALRLPLLIASIFASALFIKERNGKFFLMTFAAFILMFFPIMVGVNFFYKKKDAGTVIIMQQQMENFMIDLKKERQNLVKNNADIAVFSIGTKEPDMLFALTEGIFPEMTYYQSENGENIYIFSRQKPSKKEYVMLDETTIAVDFTFEQKGWDTRVLVTCLPSLMEKGGYARAKTMIGSLMTYIHKEDAPFVLVGNLRYPPYTKLLQPILKEDFKTLLALRRLIAYRMSEGATYVHPAFDLRGIRWGRRIGDTMPMLSYINFNFKMKEKEGKLPAQKETTNDNETTHAPDTL